MRSQKIFVGSTVSKELGFVFTEAPGGYGYRYLRFYEPRSREWSFRKILFPNDDCWVSWFHHIEGNTWAGYATTDELIKFELVKK